MIKRILKKAIIYFFLILLIVITLVPFYLVTVNATHSSYEIVTKLNSF